MKKEKFTPGPWSKQKKFNGLQYFINTPIGSLLAEVHSMFIEKQIPVELDFEEMEANAALIAAAPDLYEAINMAITEIESYTDFKVSGPDSENPVINRLYEALARARGENLD